MPKPYSPALAEALGQVLLDMHDTVEAGKYLFLSGRRRPEYEAAIELYKSRFFKRGRLEHIYRSFFRGARLERFDGYPLVVQDDLTSMGATERRFGRPPALEWRIGLLWKLGGALLLLGLLLCLLVGCVTVLSEIRGWLGRE